jgi:hypothetical protein
MASQFRQKGLLGLAEEAGRVSNSSLYRVWRRAGLSCYEAGDPGRFEKVEHYAGGAALALIGAAAAESGVAAAMAGAALEAGRATAQDQHGGQPVDPHCGRDGKGHFTSAYNHTVRNGVEEKQADSRWDPDRVKRERRDLSALALLSLSPDTLGQRLLVMGMVPLVSNLRVFDGLDTPRARWLRALGWAAYRPATLDKTLSELALLDTDAALWREHQAQWQAKAREWSADGPHWSRWVRYFDITAEPYWTDKFARSGKVSRSGRVQPCLQRVTWTVYPGTVVWMQTYSGGQSLRKHVIELLRAEQASADGREAVVEPTDAKSASEGSTNLPIQGDSDEALANQGGGRRGRRPQGEEKKMVAPSKVPSKRPSGPDDDSFRLTVIDAEAAQAGFLWEVCQLPNHSIITVLKGAILKGAEILETGPWKQYGERERDQVREVTVVVKGQGAPAGGMELRAIQMQRQDTRHPHRTTFTTDAAADFLSTEEVPHAYLSRWVNQEQIFRVARQGAGLEHSHGFTGEYIAYENIESKREQAERREERTSRQQNQAQAHLEQLQQTQKSASGTELDTIARSVKDATREMKRAKARHETAAQEVRRLSSMPDRIHQRDTTRENVATASTMMVLALYAWVMREYFGGLKMELSTFLEYFLHLPMQVRTTWSRTLYRIDMQDLPADKAELLQQACEEITSRRIRLAGRRLKFEAVDMSKSRDSL